MPAAEGLLNCNSWAAICVPSTPPCSFLTRRFRARSKFTQLPSSHRPQVSPDPPGSLHGAAQTQSNGVLQAGLRRDILQRSLVRTPPTSGWGAPRPLYTLECSIFLLQQVPDFSQHSTAQAWLLCFHHGHAYYMSHTHYRHYQQQQPSEAVEGGSRQSRRRRSSNFNHGPGRRRGS